MGSTTPRWISIVDRLTDRSATLFRRYSLDSPRALLMIWTATRLLVVLIWGVCVPSTQGDVVYYYEHIDFMFDNSPQVTMQEYPTPVLWFLMIPWFLGFGTQQGYVIVFVGIMLVLDALFSWDLWRHGGSLAPQAVGVWSIFVVFIGPTMYLRFDIITCVLAGWSVLLLMRRRNNIAGAFAGVGAAVKLWPALLWPALCTGSRRQKIVTTIGFWITGVVLALGSLIWAGWDRLISPLSWQSGRGLQVESVWASVPMFLRSISVGDYAVTISRFQAFEIYGTGVHLWSMLSTFATVAGLLFIAVTYIWWWQHGKGRILEGCVFILLVILIMLTTNKTFSPQYMIWLGGPLSASLVILGHEDRSRPSFALERTRLLRLTAGVLAATVLTGIVYPIGYTPLVRDNATSYWLRLPVTLVLVARNVIVVFLTIQAMRWVLTFLRRPPQSPTVKESA